MSFENVLAHINTVYVLKTKPEEMCVNDHHEEIASLRLKVGNSIIKIIIITYLVFVPVVAHQEVQWT